MEERKPFDLSDLFKIKDKLEQARDPKKEFNVLVIGNDMAKVFASFGSAAHSFSIATEAIKKQTEDFERIRILNICNHKIELRTTPFPLGEWKQVRFPKTKKKRIRKNGRRNLITMPTSTRHF